MQSFNLSITTPEKVFFNGPCENLIVPLSDGMYGISKDHANTIFAIVTGQIEIKVPENDSKIYGAISDGILKVEDGNVYLLCDTVEKPEEIDEIRARERIEALEEELKMKSQMREYYVAEMDLKRSLNRLKVKKNRGKI